MKKTIQILIKGYERYFEHCTDVVIGNGCIQFIDESNTKHVFDGPFHVIYEK